MLGVCVVVGVYVRNSPKFVGSGVVRVDVEYAPISPCLVPFPNNPCSKYSSFLEFGIAKGCLVSALPPPRYGIPRVLDA